jgi:tetratricopeptide (TPR) repeat protein
MNLPNGSFLHKQTFIIFLVYFSLFPVFTIAHLSINEQIVDLTKRLETEPDQAKRATLYLRRGELHRVHRDWSAALADYESARALEPGLAEVDLHIGRAMFEAGRPEHAKLALDRFLGQYPNHVKALVTRARVFVQLGAPLAAAHDFTRAIAQFQPPNHPLPEYYLERAQALAAAGDAYIDAALRGLDDGINRLGNLVTLQLYAVDLELVKQRYAAALHRLDRLIAQTPHMPHVLARRGEIYEQAGRLAEARQAYTEALRTLTTLPSSRRTSTSVVSLETRLRDAVERLAAHTTK